MPAKNNSNDVFQKYGKKYSGNLNGPATKNQKKFVAAIFKHQGYKFEWDSPMTFNEASSLIEKYGKDLPPRKEKSRWI